MRLRLRAHRDTVVRRALAGLRCGPRRGPVLGPRPRKRDAHGDCGSGGSTASVRTGSGGFGSALIAQYTTAQRYTIGIFRTNIMKTSSQTSIPKVYEMVPRPDRKGGRPRRPCS